MAPAGRYEGFQQKESCFAAKLTKPIKPTRLLRCLLSVLQKSAPPSGAPERKSQDRLISGQLENKKRILIVEDNVTNQKVVQWMVEKLGYQCHVVSGGAEAVAALSAPPYDLVLMDMEMPVMNGIQATALIREREAQSCVHVPIIAMTAHTEKEYKDRCMHAGMEGYVTKPIQPPELANTLGRFLGSENRISDAYETIPPNLEGEIFDKTRLIGRLEDAELCQELIGVFAGDFPDQIENLKEAIQKQDLKTLERRAHTIKGAAANVEARSLSRAAFAIEKAGKENNLDFAQKLVTDLEREFDKFLNALKP
jgi:CheY-like chemotaxis protein